jgi:prevent-host-death family protein
MTDAEPIGIRELRQNASRYVDMAEHGRRVPVTKRGKLVAYLVPAEEPRSVYEQMVAAGQARPALRRGTRGLPPPLPLDDDGPSLSEVLRQMRDEERY